MSSHRRSVGPGCYNCYASALDVPDFLEYFVLHNRCPDQNVGQFPMAYVVRKAGSSLSENDIMDFVGKQVS